MPHLIPGMICAAISTKNGVDTHWLTQLLTAVSPDRLERLAKTHLLQDVYNSMLGELLARYLAGFKLNVSPAGLILAGERGQRPFLKGHPDLAVSIAHAEDYVIAVIDDGAAGVDIEPIRPFNLDEISGIVPPGGFVLLKSMTETDRLLRFYKVWTAFESYYKATGLKLPDECVIHLISGNAFVLEPCFRGYRLDPDYCTTVFSATQRFAPRFDLLSWHELISAFDVR